MGLMLVEVAQPRCGWGILRDRIPGLLCAGGASQPLGFGAEGRWPSERVSKAICFTLFYLVFGAIRGLYRTVLPIGQVQNYP